MFIILGDICFDSLPEGDMRKRRLTPGEACDIIAEGDDALTGCFDFGSVPSPRRDRDFRNLIYGLRDRHGIALDPKIFFSRPADQDEENEAPSSGVFPIPPQLARLCPNRPLLVVGYAFTMNREREKADSGDPISWFQICPDSITFHLLELIAPAE